MSLRRIFYCTALPAISSSCFPFFSPHPWYKWTQKDDDDDDIFTIFGVLGDYWDYVRYIELKHGITLTKLFGRLRLSRWWWLMTMMMMMYVNDHDDHDDDDDFQHASKIVWRMETVILLATLALLLLTLNRWLWKPKPIFVWVVSDALHIVFIMMPTTRRDPNGRVFGWFSSCVSFFPLLVTTIII